MKKITSAFGFEDALVKDFLDFPKTLYEKDKCPQDIKTEKQILKGNHVLSKDIEVMPFVVYWDNGEKKVVARAMVTYYKDDDRAYVGFFESIDDAEVCRKLFGAIQTYAGQNGKKSLVGPVDASFWIRYRFKISSDREFVSTYSSEPYNKAYYVRLWEACGFVISQRYESNFYRQVQPEDISPRLHKRYLRMSEQGYILRTSSFWRFDKDLVEIHRLITKTYKNFPLYTDLSLEKFKALFGYLKFILNYKMVKLLEKDNEAVGFMICVPNFGFNSLGKLTASKFAKILGIKNKPKEYVILYMGVDEKHLGLGSALAEDIKNELCKNGCTSVGALILQGKVTSYYYTDLVTGKSQYVLLEKENLWKTTE